MIRTITPSETLPLTDDVITDSVWGADCGDVTGELLVNYDEGQRTVGGETYPCNVRGAEIVGLHLGGSVILSRDALIAMTSLETVKRVEATLYEARLQLC